MNELSRVADMIIDELRTFLVSITGDQGMSAVSEDTALLGGGLGLDSVSAVRLLRSVRDRFGVDVAAEDMNLDSMASLGALARFVAEQVDSDHWSEPGDFTDLRELEAFTPKRLYVTDGGYAATELVHDLERLTDVCVSAVKEHGGHVLKETHVVFPNGAITLVLILAESHLSVHTWPEEKLIAIDLFSCGAIDGRGIIDRLAADLSLDRTEVRELTRGWQAVR